MVATHIEMIKQSMLCVTGVYSRKIINIFSRVGQMSGLVKNFHFGISSDTANVINVKLFMTVLLIQLDLFIPLSVTLTIF